MHPGMHQDYIVESAGHFSSEPKDVNATLILIDKSMPEGGIDEERVGCYRGRHPIHVVEERGNSVLGLLVSLQAIDKGALKESELALVQRLAERIEVLLLNWWRQKGQTLS